MNILLLSEHFLPSIGGGEFVVHYWAKSLTKRGHKVVVPALKPFLNSEPDKMKFEYEVDRFPFIPYMPDISRIIQVYRLNARYHFDIIHANFVYRAGYTGARLQDLFKIPCVATAQGADLQTYEPLGYGGLLNPKIKKETEKTVQKLSGLIYTSDNLKNIMLGMNASPDKLYYVVNGTPYKNMVSEKRNSIRHDIGTSAQETVFMLVSRNRPIKGLHLVVEAVSLLKQSNLNFKIVVIGPETEKLNDLVNKFGVGKYFKIIGNLPIQVDSQTLIPEMPSQQVIDYLCAADVFIAPALSGGFELSAMDAMAAGLAIIISENIGNKDLVKNAENGFIVANNSPSQIAEAMLRLLESPALVESMKRFNREYSRQYDWDCIAEQLEDVYCSVIKKWQKSKLNHTI